MTEKAKSNANGANARRRPVPLFDPVAGMRAMAEVQAEGLRAASDLFERALGPDQEDRTARPPSQSPSSAPEGDYSALVDAWAELLQRVATGLARPAERGTVTVPVDSDAVAPPVRLELEDSEQPDSAAGEIWLHNGTSAAVGPLVMSCGPLSASDGEVLEARVEFDPAELPSLPPRSSRGVVVSVAVGSRPVSGVYRGTIQAEGAPALWLPIEVAVRPC
jgi:hypothetical protein